MKRRYRSWTKTHPGRIRLAIALLWALGALLNLGISALIAPSDLSWIRVALGAVLYSVWIFPVPFLPLTAVAAIGYGERSRFLDRRVLVFYRVGFWLCAGPRFSQHDGALLSGASHPSLGEPGSRSAQFSQAARRALLAQGDCQGENRRAGSGMAAFLLDFIS